MKKILLLTTLFFSFVSLTPKSSWYCACCAERGQYDIQTQVLDEFMLGVLQEMKFQPGAELYVTNADDGLTGLKPITAGYEAHDWENDRYYLSVTNSFTNKTWKLNFKTADGKAGSLTLPAGGKMVSAKMDIHESPDSAAMIVLYKEMRFKGAVLSGDGFFKAGLVKPVAYTLLLQGHGNNCENTEDYTHWRLEVTGPKAKYAFFGKLN